MKHGFVILNYNSGPDCILAVDSIKDFYQDVVIIVVDNCSTDNSYMYLKGYSYLFDLIKTDSNLGYGRGNNYGFKYLISNYQVDFIHIMNPDVKIGFTGDINDYSPSDFYVMGPDVKSFDMSCSPIRSYKSKVNLKQYVRNMKIYSKIYYFLMSLFSKHLGTKLERTFNCFNNKKRKKVHVLSGCYLIFSSEYFKKVNNLFYEGIFLYDEEIVMFYFLNRLSLSEKVIYNDQIQVIHNHINGDYKTKVKNTQKNFKVLEKIATYDDEEIRKLWFKGGI